MAGRITGSRGGTQRLSQRQAQHGRGAQSASKASQSSAGDNHAARTRRSGDGVAARSAADTRRRQLGNGGQAHARSRARAAQERLLRAQIDGSGTSSPRRTDAGPSTQSPGGTDSQRPRNLDGSRPRLQGPNAYNGPELPSPFAGPNPPSTGPTWPGGSRPSFRGAGPRDRGRDSEAPQNQTRPPGRRNIEVDDGIGHNGSDRPGDVRQGPGHGVPQNEDRFQFTPGTDLPYHVIE